MANNVAFLKPLTPEAESSLGAQLFQIPKFPFRVGRKSHRSQKVQYLHLWRRGGSASNNDLCLTENESLLNVSREHFQIESCDDRFFIIDRGSACGTLVDGVVIGGGRRGGKHLLHNGDVIIVGMSESRHIYKFIVEQS
jgi:pSer/pThr/pTyr-binding forkhead associated (FHA) protein